MLICCDAHQANQHGERALFMASEAHGCYHTTLFSLALQARARSRRCGGTRYKATLTFKGARIMKKSATEFFFRRNAVTNALGLQPQHTIRRPGDMRAAQEWDAVSKSMECVLQQEAKERALNRDAIATLRR